MIAEPVVYCFVFGWLVAVAATAILVPLTRSRKAVEAVAKASEIAKPSDERRVSHAMRQWAAERAGADLEPVAALRREPDPPPAPRPAPVAKAPAPPPPPPPEPEEDATDESTAVSEANPFLAGDFEGKPNFYDILQISPRADLETIHRVYRIMAARFHPDNPESGDHERFLELQEAYEVLSRPDRRAQYDCALRAQEVRPLPVFEDRIFVDGLDGEVNRRVGVLALLYQRRRVNQNSAGISMLLLEQRMSLPREHLDFTLWYLRSKSFVQVLEDNSDFAITAAGVDFVEANSSKSQILRDVLTATTAAGAAHAGPRPGPASVAKRRSRRATRQERRSRGEGPRIVAA